MAELLGRRLARHLPLLDPIAEAVQPRVRSALDGNPRLRAALEGQWLGTPLHPPLTDVPIGAGTAAVLFDAAETLTGSQGMARAADASLALGVLGALPAATTGVTDWRDLRRRAAAHRHRARAAQRQRRSCSTSPRWACAPPGAAARRRRRPGSPTACRPSPHTSAVSSRSGSASA